MDDEGSSAVVPAKPSEGLVGWVESVIITVSQTSAGQTLLKLMDRFLWVVEKSAQWSLPVQEVTSEENGKSFGTMKLVRPLPWILFLPGLVILRAIRGGLNVGAFILGYPGIQPSGMVRFVQKGRRRLRALNLRAIKSLRHKTYSTSKDKRLSMIEAKKALIRSIKLTLSTLSCLDSSKSSPSPPPTKIHITGMDLEPASTPDEKSTTESTASPGHQESKRKYSEVSSGDDSVDELENEPLVKKLDRLALEDSMEDPDFNPADCSTDASSSSEEEEPDLVVSLSEIDDLKKEAQTALSEIDVVAYTPIEGQGTLYTDHEKSAQDEDISEKAEISDIAEFHSPMKSVPDCDSAFYSPISSKCGSPERSLTPCPEKESEPYTDNRKASDIINGEVNCNTGRGANDSEVSPVDVTNGVVPEKRNTTTSRYHHHHKGKRTGHGNRRKK